jgi:hypothetical protein
MITNSPIVNPAGYTVDIIVKFDPITGNTELQVSNKGRTPVEMIKVAALLCQHGATLLANILKGNLQPKNNGIAKIAAGEKDGGNNA